MVTSILAIIGGLSLASAALKAIAVFVFRKEIKELYKLESNV